MRLKNMLFLVIVFFSFSINSYSLCKGPIIDPITRIRWNCMLPITIGGINMGTSGNPLADKIDNTLGSTSPLCVCMDPLPRIGITLGYREVLRIVESVKQPFCFPFLGMGLEPGLWGLAGDEISGETDGVIKTYTHDIVFLPFLLLQLFTDIICARPDFGIASGISMGYLSELDPLRASEAVALIAYPETILFSNPIAISACEIADSISTLAEYTLDPLFWCAGGHSIYPLGSYGKNSTEYVDNALINGAKSVYILHRDLLLWGSLGNQALCGVYPMPIWRKMQYRLQPAFPIPDFYCRRIGQTPLIWSHGLNLPGTGMTDNMGFILWRKRDCCAF